VSSLLASLASSVLRLILVSLASCSAQRNPSFRPPPRDVVESSSFNPPLFPSLLFLSLTPPSLSSSPSPLYSSTTPVSLYTLYPSSSPTRTCTIIMTLLSLLTHAASFSFFPFPPSPPPSLSFHPHHTSKSSKSIHFVEFPDKERSKRQRGQPTRRER